MKYCIVGNRGVGKTQLLERIKIYYPEMISLDLDLEIELFLKEPIKSYFEKNGESSFRKIEQQVFRKIYSEHSHFVLSLGAGFPLDELPKDIYTLFVKRKTDSLGRIFWDRPRLNPKVSALEEYFERKNIREPKYLQQSSQVYIMPEGIRLPDSQEKNLLGFDKSNSVINAGGILTLLSYHLHQLDYLKRIKVDYFEWREDLLEFTMLKNLIANPEINQKFIYSFRNKERSTDKNNSQHVQKLIQEFQIQHPNQFIFDWALELGPCPSADVHIVSLHDFLPNEDLECFLFRLEESATSPAQWLKASPIIENFYELEMLREWQAKDPHHRNILPRTKNDWIQNTGYGEGRWGWFRLFMKSKQKINFWKDYLGSAPDQPTIMEWLAVPNEFTEFAAVLGYPVRHSRTPQEHKKFWLQKNMPVFAIDIAEEQWPFAINICCKLGLKFAAVTAPLKKLAFELTTENDVYSKEFQSVNSLMFLHKNNQIIGANTDFPGLLVTKLYCEETFDFLKNENQNISNLKYIIWGGGGTLEVVKKVWPRAIPYSMRTGKPRDQKDELELDKLKTQTVVVIWACGPKDPFPPENIRPQLIIDLNYREDSMARDYALQNNCPYISGDKMFVAQADQQMRFVERNWK